MNSPLTTAAEPVLILNGCALEQLRTLPDACVDAIVTSPPYWGLRDYGIEPTDWPACSYAPMPGLPAIEVPAERSCLGLEPTLHAFLAHLVLIFEECRRVLKPTGSAWVNMGDGYAGSWGGQSRDENHNSPVSGTQIKAAPKQTHTGSMSRFDGLKPKDLIGQPWRVAFALQAAGWYLRQDNIWHKPNPMPECIRDRATKAHEYVFHLTRSERYFFDLEAWSEKAGDNTHPRRAGNGYKMPDGWDTGKGGHGTFHRNGREKGAPAPKAMPEHDGKVKNNASMDAALAVMPLTRNKRSVWTVPTVAYSEAHYATYPPRLITPPILASTSAKGCCAACGKPWERVVEKTGHVNKREAAHVPGNTRTKTDSTGWAPQSRPTDQWHPTCDCADRSVRAPIVLDPFGGSGTTAQVALEHGRHAILIERGPHNIVLIRKRLAPVLAAPVLHLA